MSGALGNPAPTTAAAGTARLTDYSSSELMLGETLVGARVRDFRSVLQYVRSRKDVDASRIALWGDSFAPVNPAGKSLAAPLDAANLPPSSEPLGGLVVLFTALLENEKDIARSTLAVPSSAFSRCSKVRMSTFRMMSSSPAQSSPVTCRWWWTHFRCAKFAWSARSTA